MTLSTEVQFALSAVRQMVRLVRKAQMEFLLPQLTKGDKSPVTVADFAGQAFFGKLLSATYPEDPLVAEEKSDALQSPEAKPTLDKVTAVLKSVLGDVDPEDICAWIDRGRSPARGRFWTLDPIDGTQGFLRGDQYVVALALIVDGQVEISVLGCPLLNAQGETDKSGDGALVLAVRGQGAWSSPLKEPLELSPLRVSMCQAMCDATVLRSVQPNHIRFDKSDSFLSLAGTPKPLVPMDSLAKYFVVAAGRGEVFFYHAPADRPVLRMKIWDVAPGVLIVEEAGGRVSDFAGRKIHFDSEDVVEMTGGLVVTNGLLHENTLDILRRMK